MIAAMTGSILVLNAGSSSLKFAVYEDADAGRLAAQGRIEGIGSAARLSVRDGGGQVILDRALDAAIGDGRSALSALVPVLRPLAGGERIVGVGHRIVHGGTRFERPTVISPPVLEELRRLVPLAPLHQPHNLSAVETVSELFPGVTQVACFDTSFHRGHPAVAQLIPLPRDVCGREVQRYGFHGLSYEYIASVLPQVAPEIAEGR